MYLSKFHDDLLRRININMRCIEIEQYLLQKMEHKEININMRCIEIFGLMLNIMVFIGLTLT